MGAALAPWPFLVGGATAVEVALLLDGDVLEQRYLWPGSDVSEARDGSGIVRVRRCDDGFELLIHGVTEGVVGVGEQSVTLRELGLCGVVALPIGPKTTARLQFGATELRVAGTTAPRKQALAPRRSARELMTLVAGGAAALVCATGIVVTMNAAPRRPDWELRYDAWLERLTGDRTKSTIVKFYGVESPLPRHDDATTPAAAASAHADSARKPAATGAAKSHPDAPRALSAPSSRARVGRGRELRMVKLSGSAWRSDPAFFGDLRLAGSVAHGSADRGLVSDDARGAAGLAANSRGDAESGAGSGVASGSGASGSGASGSGASGNATAANGDDESGRGGGLGGGGLGGGGLGGGGDEQAIAVGDIGTIGRGSGSGNGSGSGYGYGSADGRLQRRIAAVVDVADRPQIRGGCDADAIRRVVRAHHNEVRFCYERSLQSQPDLRGRIVARFDIAHDGSARDASVDSSSVTDPLVAACVAGAIRRWQFPGCAAAVSYPFVFVPIGEE